MNIKSSLVVFSVATILASAASVRAQEVTPSIQSFEQWCQQKDTLPAGTKKTVEVLLQKAGTEDCKAADLQLNSLTELSLNSNQISDVQPLASLTNLTLLRLSGNQISDVQPLSSLTNLTILDLSENATLTNRICPVRPESICRF